MQELELGENELGMKVFINGVPDLASVPQEMLESILPALERGIAGSRMTDGEPQQCRKGQSQKIAGHGNNMNEERRDA